MSNTKQKTAIRQAIEDIQNDREFSLPMINYLVKRLSKYEPVNEQQIKDAYDEGYENTYNPCDSCGMSPKIDESASQYFNQTFEKP